MADPRQRAETALEALYRYYREGRPMLEKVLRDAPLVPELDEVMVPWREYLAELAGGLAVGWEGPSERRRLLRAAAGHAVRFETWRTLSREGLDEGEAAHLVAQWMAATADPTAPVDARRPLKK